MDVFTPAQRENHIQNIAQLFQSVQEIHEVIDGYTFIFPSNIELTQLADFISEERLCCPFLEFTLKIKPDQKPISLTLTGPIGTQEFLREEFSEVFA
jgi:hypothetical protein